MMRMTVKPKAGLLLGDELRLIAYEKAIYITAPIFFRRAVGMR
jgi:hypothetical protein